METNKKPNINAVPKSANLYPIEMIPKYIQKLKEKAVKPIRAPRTDLVKGTIVVVLEGRFASKRVVFLKQLPGNLALCSGVVSINNVPAFKIDERYLLKTSTVVDIDCSVDFECDLESKRGETVQDEDVLISKQEEVVQKEIVSKINKIKYMRAYLEAPFELDMENFEGLDSLNF